MSFPYLVRLVPFCFRCAEVIEQNDISQANKLIAELRQHSSATGNASQRTAHYFMEALVSLLTGPHHFVTQVAAVEHGMQLTMNLETRYNHVKWMYGLKIVEIFVIVILGKKLCVTWVHWVFWLLHSWLFDDYSIDSQLFSWDHCLKVNNWPESWRSDCSGGESCWVLW